MTDTYELSDLMTRKLRRTELEALPVLSTGQASDLRYNDGRTRIWTARTGLADGERFARRVTIEVYAMGSDDVPIWKIAREYGVH
jgi:hypothetical protein